MVLAVLADEDKQKEFAGRSWPDGTEIVYADSWRSFDSLHADAYFVLQDILDPQVLKNLSILSKAMLVVNAVSFTTADLNENVIRINAWSTMIGREKAEIAFADSLAPEPVFALFHQLNWPVQRVPDIVGMVVPRIVAAIINEAYITLQSGVSSSDEIDIAMRLGTNYPYGPFEWSRKIGIKNVQCLLTELGRTDPRYIPTSLLVQDAQDTLND